MQKKIVIYDYVLLLTLLFLENKKHSSSLYITNLFYPEFSQNFKCILYKEMLSYIRAFLNIILC